MKRVTYSNLNVIILKKMEIMYKVIKLCMAEKISQFKKIVKSRGEKIP